MLDLTEPLEVSEELQYGGKRGVVTLRVDPPSEAWLREAAQVFAMPEGPEQLAAFEALNAPERLAPCVVGWEGVGKPDTPTPCTAENVVAACKKKAFRDLLQVAVALSHSRVLEKNSETSPVGTTGEVPANVPAAANAAEPSPSTEARP